MRHGAGPPFLHRQPGLGSIQGLDLLDPLCGSSLVDREHHGMRRRVDEKSQIQALDRTQPGLPLKKGRAGTVTHMWTAPSSQVI